MIFSSKDICALKADGAEQQHSNATTDAAEEVDCTTKKRQIHDKCLLEFPDKYAFEPLTLITNKNGSSSIDQVCNFCACSGRLSSCCQKLSFLGKWGGKKLVFLLSGVGGDQISKRYFLPKAIFKFWAHNWICSISWFLTRDRRGPGQKWTV